MQQGLYMELVDTGLSRRQILAGLAGAMAVSACSASSSADRAAATASQSATARIQLATAEVGAWIPAAGTHFTTGPYSLVLAGVEQVASPGARPSDLRQQGFIAAFEIVQGGFMPGDLLYRLSSATTTTFDIFMTSSATSATRMYALFN